MPRHDEVNHHLSMSPLFDQPYSDTPLNEDQMINSVFSGQWLLGQILYKGLK